MAKSSDLEGQTLNEIAEYHNDAVDSLTFFFQPVVQQNNTRFFGYSLAEFNRLLVSRIEETDLRSSLTVLAALEAALHVDYQVRATRRLKDPLSRAFRTIYKTRQTKPRLDDILDLWSKHYPNYKHLVGDLRAALQFRHWLAHGRYWARPAHGRFDYISIYTLADLMITNLPLWRN